GSMDGCRGLASEHMAQLTLADRHRRARSKGPPQPFMCRACVAFGQARPIAVEPPCRGPIPDGERADAARMSRDATPKELPVRELAQRCVPLTHCVLQPPRDAAAGEAQAERLVHAATAAG